MDSQSTDEFLDRVQQTLPQSLQHKTSQYQQLHLKYSYSGISNASSSNDFALTTTRSFNQEWAKLNFVQAQKLFETLSKTASELQKRMLIDEDLILHLLYLYRWNEERLMDVYYDKHAKEYQEMDGKLKQNRIQGKQGKQKGEENECEVCYRAGVGVVNAVFCQHSYCIECWKSYIKQNLTQGKIFFPACMAIGCDQNPVLLQFVKGISTSLAELYRKKICVNYAIVNKSVSYCPSDSCPLFCEKNMLIQQSTVECPCGVFYCFRCERQPHEPAVCEEVEKWEKLTNHEKHNEDWMKRYTRKCPSCKQAVEKYVGCNHVKCCCGQEFCFSCNQQWDEAHKSTPEHCSKQKSPNLSNQTEEKDSSQLQKLADKIIYFSRRMNSDMALIKKTEELLTKQQPLHYLKELFQDLKPRIHHSWTTLKWSIVALNLRQMPSIQVEIEKDTLQSIKSLLQTVEKIQKKVANYHTLSQMLYADSKQLLHLKEELFKRKETLSKTIEVWNEAWKSVVGEY